MWPRGGGIWDQDPMLVRDFRTIQSYEREYKETQEKIEEQKRSSGIDTGGSEIGGGGLGIEGALNEYLESLGEEGTF